jgi:hypothetical protein
VVLKLIEMQGPQMAIGGEPVIELNQWLGPHAIETSLRVTAHLDQASLL